MLLSLLALLLSACATRPRVADAPSPAAPETARESVFDERWSEYVDWELAMPVQSGCEPFRVDPPGTTPYRGTVVMLHGFSGCPQQYHEMAHQVAGRGFRVLVPLLPGHGRPYPSTGNDDSSALPGNLTWRETYAAFANQVNGIMEYAAGERVSVGLSGGGAVSLYLNDRRRDIYDRNLVMSPFIAIAGGRTLNGAVTVLGNLPFLNLVGVTPFHTADPCIEKRKQGKAGYCTWQLRHAQAMKALGSNTARRLKKTPLENTIQLVGVENDHSIANRRVVELIDIHAGNGQASACFYPAGVPHSMFSRMDHPGEDMYWLGEFMAAAVAFIVDGHAFPVAGKSPAHAPVDQCELLASVSAGSSASRAISTPGR